MSKRELLGDFAEEFAAKSVTGTKSDTNYLEMLKYYPDNDPDEFVGCWCCTFVFHCCRQVRLDLPLGTHKTARAGSFRWFTSVIAWYEWAQVSDFIHNDTPERGDIVIYNNIVPEQYKQKDCLWCDHVGIVLSFDGDFITAAEGNIDNKNISGIVRRKRDDTIGCYIRIPENYINDEL